jgi:hypothetical protein
MTDMSIPSATPASTSRRGSRWSEEEESHQLRQEIESGVALEEVAKIHRRTPGAIQERANRYTTPCEKIRFVPFGSDFIGNGVFARNQA